MSEDKLVAKGVMQEVKIARLTASAATHYGALEQRWAAALGQGNAALLTQLLQGLGQQLTTSSEALERGEQALVQERQDDEAPRAARDEAVAQLERALLGVKSLIGGTFGAEALATYGLSGANPVTPDALRAYAGNAVNLLRANPRVAVDIIGRETKTEDLISLLDSKLPPLDAALKDVRRESLELNDSLVRRDEAREALGDLVSFSRRLIDAALRLAEQDAVADKLARRLRPASSSSPSEAGDEDALPPLEPSAEG